MAIMIPDLNERQLENIESRAEKKLYKILRKKLSDKYHVFFQVAWLLKKEEKEAKDGEIDFVICHPKYGYLCIEVKGGGVLFEAEKGVWFSIDVNGKKNSIKDPIKEARNARYSILSKLKENELWSKLVNKRIGCGHAIFFTDVNSATPFIRPDMPEVLIGVAKNMEDIQQWVEGCFNFWHSSEMGLDEWGKTGVEVFGKIFAKSIEVRPLLGTCIEKEEQERIKLTDRQILVLDMLSRKRKMAVSGGAGTGKTLLAINKAEKLANDNFSTLLTCYNRPLSKHLKMVCKNGNGLLDVMDFHQLCKRVVDDTQKITGKDYFKQAKQTMPTKDEFEIQYPYAALFALEDNEKKYDAIICDEGQDFTDEYWFVLESMLKEGGIFYIFFDDNQNLYSKKSNFPIKSEDTILLNQNCRNTEQIHSITYKFYKGDPIKGSTLVGPEVEYVIGNTTDKQSIKIQNRIIKLINEDNINPGDITILVADAINQAKYMEALVSKSLPKGIRVNDVEHTNNGQPIITTVNKFKGLESQVVFLWGLDYMDEEKIKMYMYVGLSRAKTVAIVVSDRETNEIIKNS